MKKVNDKNVTETLKKVETKLDALYKERDTQVQYVTPGAFSINNQRYNMHTVSNLSDFDRLADIWVAMTKEATMYHDAHTFFGRKVGEVKFEGYLLTNWYDDLKKKYRQLEVYAEIKRLEKIKNDLNQYISENLREKMGFNALLDELGEI